MPIAAVAPVLVLLPVVLVLALVLLATLARRRQRRREAYIEDFDFARLLDRRLAARRPALSASQREEVFEGLRQWFQLARTAGRRPLSMPSQAVDDAWHEFILFTRNYAAFCRHALGRFLHHVPAEAMTTPTRAQDGLRRAWRLACRREAIDPRTPLRLPALFALDAALAIPDGFHYRLDCLAARAAGAGNAYCAGHIGCSSGCGSDSSDSGDGGDGGCGSGCGGD